ncbi:MAG TPA: TauD/TfdA family dioxygenase [Candidatus Paceibacterota bacterium]
MESTKNCNNYPKRVFGSELAPESFFVPVRSSKEVPSSANSIISLLNTYGVAVVEFEENESARQQLLCFGQLFGNTMRHDRSDDDGIAEVAVIDESSVYPGVSSRAYTFHTDGSYDENPPPIVALRCEIPARRGGVTQLASGKKLHEWLLSKDRAALETLYEKDSLSIKRAGKSFSGAVFTEYSGNRVRLRYRSDEAALASDSQKTQKAINLVQDFLSEEENLVSFELGARQVLLTDNFTVLHGRTAFEADDPRRMHRLWFDRLSSNNDEVCVGFIANK